MSVLTANMARPTPRSFAALFTAGLLMLGAGAAQATDEVHIITRDGGAFVSSHRLYENKRPRTTAVDYCGRDYFVYRSTIEWTETAAARGYSVALEYSDGTSWEVICLNPQDQVASKDFKQPDLVAERAFRKRTKGGSWIDIVTERRKTKYNLGRLWRQRNLGDN